MEHLDATVLGDPARNQHFEMAVAFVASQMTAKQTKNNGRTQDRTIAAFGRDTGRDDRDDRGNKNDRNGHHMKPPYKKKKRSKFNPRKPKEWIKNNRDWANLSDEEKTAARKAWAEAGIPTHQERLARQQEDQPQRIVGALSTQRDTSK